MESRSPRRAFKLEKLSPPCKEQGKPERGGRDTCSGEDADKGYLEARSGCGLLGFVRALLSRNKNWEPDRGVLDAHERDAGGLVLSFPNASL